ncbi:MAG: cytidylate kinase-like family protein [Muribaculaceae bacterium]|nr:cytidylate kinase-like family protein [Muribaculaceae bacterium]
MLPKNFVITIGRTFGSGGRALGKIIAERLGIGFYDKQLLVKSAQKAGYNVEYFEKNDERAPRILGGIIPFSMGFYPMSWIGDTVSSSDGIYKAQSDFMHELADNESCVIVGRSADYILRDRPNVINIFVHAPAADCARRIVSRFECDSEEQAIALADRTNKLRANFYNFYTDKKWGDSRSYDLCVDSSLLPLEELADYIIDYVKRRLDK